MTVRHLRSRLLAPIFVLSLAAPAAAQTPSCSDLAKDYWFRFSSGPTLHRAHLRMVGCTGRMFVRFHDATHNQDVTVSQAMRLRQSSEGTWVEGSNPVDSATGLANATYLPDKLLFQMMANGRLGVGNCDQPNACSEVQQAMRLAVQNTCSDAISFAVVYADPAEGDALVRAGWWTVRPNQTVETPIQTFADSFFIRGQTGSRVWSGPDSFVVTPDGQFRARVDQLTLSRIIRRVGFKKVVLTDKVQRYVQQFVCRARD